MATKSRTFHHPGTDKIGHSVSDCSLKRCGQNPVDQKGTGIGSECSGEMIFVHNSKRGVAAHGYITEAERSALEKRIVMQKLPLTVTTGNRLGSNTNVQLTADAVIRELAPRKKRPEILITIENGLLGEVSGVPPGYMVRIIDFNTDGVLSEDGCGLFETSDGAEFTQQVYVSDGLHRSLSEAVYDDDKRIENDDEAEEAEIAGTAEPLRPTWAKTIDITAMEWFDKTYGNSYFSAQVTVNFGQADERTLYIPMQSGSGSQYEWAARDLLVREKLLPETGAPLRLVCENQQIVLRRTVIDKQKERDVQAFGIDPSPAELSPTNF